MTEILIKLLALLKAKAFTALATAKVDWVREALIALVEGLLADRRSGLSAA